MNKSIDYNRVIKVPESGLCSLGTGAEKINNDYCLKDRIKNVLIPENILRKRIQGLGRQIATEYKSNKQLYLIPILKGAFVFAADLGREIVRCGGPEIKIDFYEAETYGIEIKTEGEEKRKVNIIRRPKIPKGMDVILLDDVGDTVQTVTAILKDAGESLGIDQSRIRVCFLLDKILRTPAEEVKRLKDQLGRGGGFILEPGITIQADIPLNNLVAMIEEARAS